MNEAPYPIQTKQNLLRVDQVQFFEPPWRWFLSHKGIWAWITRCLEEDKVLAADYDHLPLLRTYMTPERFISEGKLYVSKPGIGRMSNNIEIHYPNGGEPRGVKLKTDGAYPDEVRVYQEYHAPHQVEGRNNFIIGMWMSNGGIADTDKVWPGMVASTLCIREFESPFLGVQNERFIPHRLIL